jgi:hypothetical protein
MQLTTRLSNKSWLGDEDSGEEDPFAEVRVLRALSRRPTRRLTRRARL